MTRIPSNKVPGYQKADGTPTPIIPGWKLIFGDEFDGTSLDIKKWNIEDMSIGGYHDCCLGYGVQYFTPQALSVLHGSLRITTQEQNLYGYNYNLSAITAYHYTSGAITTENKFSFTYGRVDIRARLPKTQGLWPAFWLLPPDSVAVAPYEIDIMELLGKDPTTVHMANHWGTQQISQNFTGPDFSQGYHVFSMIWTSQAITWYVDGIQRFESEQGIPHQSMYLIINSNLGGHWAGNPNASTILPQYLDIDYVRVYQMAAKD